MQIRKQAVAIILQGAHQLVTSPTRNSEPKRRSPARNYPSTLVLQVGCEDNSKQIATYKDLKNVVAVEWAKEKGHDLNGLNDRIKADSESRCEVRRICIRCESHIRMKNVPCGCKIWCDECPEWASEMVRKNPLDLHLCPVSHKEVHWMEYIDVWYGIGKRGSRRYFLPHRNPGPGADGLHLQPNVEPAANQGSSKPASFILEASGGHNTAGSSSIGGNKSSAKFGTQEKRSSEELPLNFSTAGGQEASSGHNTAESSSIVNKSSAKFGTQKKRSSEELPLNFSTAGGNCLGGSGRVGCEDNSKQISPDKDLKNVIALEWAKERI